MTFWSAQNDLKGNCSLKCSLLHMKVLTSIKAKIQDGGALVVNILVFDLCVQLQHCTYQRKKKLFALIKVIVLQFPSKYFRQNMNATTLHTYNNVNRKISVGKNHDPHIIFINQNVKIDAFSFVILKTPIYFWEYGRKLIKN